MPRKTNRLHPDALEEIVNLLADQVRCGKTVVVFDALQDILQSVDFLAGAGIGNAASARRALARLEELHYIYRYRGAWRFNSAFFRSWLGQFA